MALYILAPDPNGQCCECRPNPCDSCGEPTECVCALFIPPFGEYEDYETAENAIEDFVADCILYATTSAVTQLDTYTISVSSTISIVMISSSDPRASGWISLSLAPGETININASVSTNGTNPDRVASISALLYDCNGVSIDGDSITGTPSSASGTISLSVIQGGVYYLNIGGGGAGDANQCNYSATISMTNNFVINPVVALWDDSGTPRQLEACPKMLIPINTESGGNWYDSEISAQEAIDEDVVNCIVYFNQSELLTSRSASGGSSLNFSAAAEPGVPGTNIFASFNAKAGDTISINCNTSQTGGTAPFETGIGITVLSYDSVIIFDDEVETTTTSAIGNFSFVAPYTGRYRIEYSYYGGADESLDMIVSTSVSITSSGLMSVNPVQALYQYDIDLDCPGRLDCE